MTSPADTLRAAHRDLARIETVLAQRPRDDKAIQAAERTLVALRKELADNPQGAKLENWCSILLIKLKGRLP